MLKRLAATSAATTLVIFLAAAPTMASDPWADDDDGGVEFGLKGQQESPGSDGASSRPQSSAPKNDDSKTNDQVRDECEDGPFPEVPACRVISFFPNTPAAAAPVDVAAEARKVRDQLDLPTPRIHTSPEDPIKTLVGLQTWLWIDSGQWAPVTESVNLDDTELTVTAKPVQTRWDMGEATQACDNPGRAWHAGLGSDADTPCSYTYRHTSVSQPNGKYAIEAAVRYHVTWKCSGDCDEDSGDLGEIDSPPATALLQVSERQTVVIQ